MDSPYPSNSKSTPPAGEPPRKAEKVVTGEVTSRPKSVGRKLRDALIGGDSKSAMQYVVGEVIIPQAKDMIAEAVTQAFERLIFGEGRSGSRRSSGRTNANYTPYNRYASRGNRPIGSAAREERPAISLKTRGTEELVFETRVDAQNVLEQMYDFLEEYHLVSVADLMAMIDKDSTHTDQKWGWENLQGSDIKRVRDGYLLILPKTVSLD